MGGFLGALGQGFQGMSLEPWCTSVSSTWRLGAWSDMKMGIEWRGSEDSLRELSGVLSPLHNREAEVPGLMDTH